MQGILTGPSRVGQAKTFAVLHTPSGQREPSQVSGHPGEGVGELHLTFAVAPHSLWSLS